MTKPLSYIFFHHSDTYTGESSEFAYTCPEDEDLRWPDVMEKFTRWLSQVYGYDIKAKVALDLNPFLEDSTWEGLTFDDLTSPGRDVADDLYDWLNEWETKFKAEGMYPDSVFKVGGTD